MKHYWRGCFGLTESWALMLGWKEDTNGETVPESVRLTIIY